jgi:hypothetical protein
VRTTVTARLTAPQPDASRGRGRPRQGDENAGQLVTLHLRMPIALRHRWHAEATRREGDLVVVLREALNEHLGRQADGPIAAPGGRLTETTAQVGVSAHPGAEVAPGPA